MNNDQKRYAVIAALGVMGLPTAYNFLQKERHDHPVEGIETRYTAILDTPTFSGAYSSSVVGYLN